jgi:hypothetical protein
MRLNNARPAIPLLSPLAAFREAVLVVLAALAYFFVRGLIDGQEQRAFRNAHRIIDLEKMLGIFIEPDLQAWVAKSDFLIDLSNWVYIWGHWPVISAFALFVLLRKPAVYFRYRNAFLISGGIGIVVFAAFPVAPPRFLDVELVDTVTERSEAYRLLQPPQLVNQYAAMPSLHFGWNLLVGIAIFRYLPWTVTRIFGVVLPVLMALAVVTTANHFILDPVAGAIVALFGLWASGQGPQVRRLLGGLSQRWRARTADG